ncbi:MAG: LytR/AlgR family response regulator transcription factor [Sediminibacterium sp.]|jgi:DNA-binding LytR/AlgR family response regulator
MMNVLIVDDEAIARKGLKEYIQEIQFLQCVAEADNPVMAMDILKKEKIDLLLCDIQMPLLDGVQFVKQLKLPPLVIFTTAYPNYALQGYELDIVDYLLKPISFDRFFKAVSKAFDLYQLKHSLSNQPIDLIKSSEQAYCFIKTDKGFIKLQYADILFIEAMHNYVVFHTTTGKQISYLKLQNVEDSLPNNQFIKIHKSFIIHTMHIQKIVSDSIWINDLELPISRSNKEEILKKILASSLIQRKAE